MLVIPEQLYTKPLLENGDHLNRLEFEARYEKLPDLKKAELIEGVVHIGSPVKITQHGITWCLGAIVSASKIRS
ncbi:hypothetical protein QUF63_01735 [Anaerolineales bacterium HSG25]|nr:hypothetical protein [Anaerolineales bacterium HSG25]